MSYRLPDTARYRSNYHFRYGVPLSNELVLRNSENIAKSHVFLEPRYVFVADSMSLKSITFA